MKKELIDFKTLKIKINNFNEKQKKYLHLVDPRFFLNNKNPYSKKNLNYKYITPIELDEDLFHLHPFMDPSVLEQGNVRRFPSGINKKYILEKYVEDKWVSEGNHHLAKELELYIQRNLKELQRQKNIKLLDIGSCGGAITTLFALSVLAKYSLLDKTEISMLDIVPNVLESTLLGEFIIPNEMIKEYRLDFAGKDGGDYKQMLNQGILIGVKEWYDGHPENKPTEFTKLAFKLSDRNENEKRSRVKYYGGDGENLPLSIKDFDIVIAGYLHHHMNYYGRKIVCEQMEDSCKKGGFIGVVDFYVKDYNSYMKWYKPHFLKHGDAPPVEYPLFNGDILSSWFSKTKIEKINNRLENCFIFSGVKE